MSRDSYSMKYAGRMGFSPFAHCLIPSNVVADLWKTYEAAARQADQPAQRSKFRISRSIFLADTTREAKERARTNSLGKNYQYIGRLFDKGLGRRIYKRDPNMSDADCNLDYLMTEQIIAGDVDEVLRRLPDDGGRDRPLRHARHDELRLGRQGGLAPQPGAVPERADARAQQGACAARSPKSVAV